MYKPDSWTISHARLQYKCTKHTNFCFKKILSLKHFNPFPPCISQHVVGGDDIGRGTRMGGGVPKVADTVGASMPGVATRTPTTWMKTSHVKQKGSSTTH